MFTRMTFKFESVSKSPVRYAAAFEHEHEHEHDKMEWMLALSEKCSNIFFALRGALNYFLRMKSQAH